MNVMPSVVVVPCRAAGASGGSVTWTQIFSEASGATSLPVETSGPPRPVALPGSAEAGQVVAGAVPVTLVSAVTLTTRAPRSDFPSVLVADVVA